MPTLNVSRPDKKKSVLLACFIVVGFLNCDYTWGQTKSAVMLTIIILMSALIHIEFKAGKYAWIAPAATGVVSAGVSYLCCQLFTTNDLFLPASAILNTVLFYLAFFAFVFAISNKIKIAASLPVAVVAVFSLVHVYVFAFRGTPLKLADLLSVQTAVKVVGEYRFFINAQIIYGLLFVITWLLFLKDGLKYTHPEGETIGLRCVSLLLGFFCFWMSWNYSATLDVKEWRDTGVIQHGLTLNLLSEAANGYSYEEPEGYAEYDISLLEKAYTSLESTERRPHIIVIMSEAYSDLRVYNGSLSTTSQVTPFVDSLTEDTVKGWVLSSVYGGNTSNSEYEFLTGNTMAFFPEGVVPFQHYVNDTTYSLVSYLNSLGYKSIGIHPSDPINWARRSAWRNLGFKEVYFEQDFPQEELVRDFVSDHEFVEMTLEILHNNKASGPLFLFGVTMQNHGGYEYSPFEQTVFLNGYAGEYPQAGQYISLLRISDSALEKLVRELEETNEDVILLFFGDHQPAVEQDLLRELNGSAFDTLDEKEKRYTVPFYIWANYDIPEESAKLTSLNYLSSYLLRCAGLPVSGYNQYLSNLETVIPVMNKLGFYSQTAGKFIPYEDATGLEKEALNQYAIVQYHSIFEKENRSKILFPD